MNIELMRNSPIREWPADGRELAIFRELHLRQEMSVDDLAQRFEVSSVTIRRGLERLAAKGLVERVHGGARAVKLPQAQMAMLQYPERKRRIGLAAAALIEPDDIVLLDAGSTVLHIARSIPATILDGGGLTVVTRALYVANVFAAYPRTRLMIVGGLYVHEFDHIVGPHAQEALRNLHVDIAFTGADGITVERGLTESNVLEAGMHEAMAAVSRRVVVVADSSKIGVNRLQTVLPLRKVDTLITDSGAPDSFVRSVRDMGVETIVVPLETEQDGFASHAADPSSRLVVGTGKAL